MIPPRFGKHVCKESSTRVKPGLTAKGTFSSWEYQADEHQIILTSGLIRIVINRHTASYTYTDEKGRLLLQEKDRDSKILDPFVSYKLAAEEEIRTEQVQTADGMKEVIREAVRVPDETLYHKKRGRAENEPLKRSSVPFIIRCGKSEKRRPGKARAARAATERE